MRFKPLIIILIMTISLINGVNALNYVNTTGDSVMVVGVNFAQKTSNSKDYSVILTADLNYAGYISPLLNSNIQYVAQYYWFNWWNDIGLNFDSGEYLYNTILDNGDSIALPYPVWRPNYYFEISDTTENLCYGLTPQQIQERGLTTQQCEIDNTRSGYYGLPFYIDYVDFTCDKANPQKGSYRIKQQSAGDIVTLGRPSYPSISGPRIFAEQGYPLGISTNKMVRLAQLTKVDCNNMDTTKNSEMNLVLKPNPLYRHTNPLTTGSETWSFKDIISSLPNIQNNKLMTFSLETTFNYTGNWWNYTITPEEYNASVDFFFGGETGDMDCLINLYNFKDIYPSNTWTYIFNLFDVTSISVYAYPDSDIPIKLSELRAKNQQISAEYKPTYSSSSYANIFDVAGSNVAIESHINTGEGLTCMYSESVAVHNINDITSNNIENMISENSQKENAYKLDLLDRELETKRLFSKTIIPYITVLLIIVFYCFQIAILGFTCFAILPIMFRQFLKGVKDSFDLSEAKGRLRGGK